jgi:hypothetical protein
VEQHPIPTTIGMTFTNHVCEKAMLHNSKSEGQSYRLNRAPGNCSEQWASARKMGKSCILWHSSHDCEHDT